MSKAMQLVGIILLGIFTLVIIYLMSDVRSTNELDYYLLQEVTEASMYDSVDYSYYRDTGLLKVDRDMFLENFTRRFAESVSNNREYKIEIIDFNETPPKVSIRATANTIASVSGETAVIETTVNGILETIYDDLVMSRGLYKSYSVDNKPPSVSTIWNENDKIYEITMEDDIALEEYCIFTLPKSNVEYKEGRDKDKVKSRLCYKNIDGEKSVTIKRNLYANNENNENNEWVIVYDRGRNSASTALANVAPYIASFSYYGDTGSLDLVLRDNDSKEICYTILVDSNDYNKGNWDNCIKSTQINSGYQAKKTIRNFYKDIAQEGKHTYYIYAKDESGLISASKSFTVNKVSGSPPVILTMKYNEVLQKIYLAFQDEDGDLKRYAITMTNSKPDDNSSSWKTISGKNKTLDYAINKGGTYYAWVEDKAGNPAFEKIQVPFYYDAVLTCGNGSTLTTERKCHYESNAAVCGSDAVSTTDPNCSVCPSGWEHHGPPDGDGKCHRRDQVFVCPSGYGFVSQIGNDCYNIYTASTSGGVCPNGGDPYVGNQCILTTSKICPANATSGGDGYCYYSVDSNNCQSTTYVAKSCDVDPTYTCPDGGTLDSSTNRCIE